MKAICFLALGAAVVIAIGAQFAFRGDSSVAHTPKSKRALYTPGTVVANGVVEGASLEVHLLPEEVGRIARIHVQAQQEVKAGDVLVELDAGSLGHQHSLAVAELARAKAKLDKVRNGERAEKRRAMAAAAEARRVEYEHRKSDLARAKKLLPSNAMSRSEYDQHCFKKLQAEALWKQAKAELDLIEAPARPEDIALAEADVAAAEAKVKKAKAELDKTVLRAPFAGRVLRVYMEAGELIGPESTQPVLTFADLGSRRVRAFVEELDSTRVKKGQAVRITSDALPGKELSGRVVQVYPRMGKKAPRSNEPGEYSDVYFREVLIDVQTREEIPINLRVEVRILVESEQADSFSKK